MGQEPTLLASTKRAASPTNVAHGADAREGPRAAGELTAELGAQRQPRTCSSAPTDVSAESCGIAF